MNEAADHTREGHYAKKQIFSASRIIAWSHRRRFATGVRLARDLAGGRVLDYGCGDGTFLAMLMAESVRPALAVGAERSADMVTDCRARLGGMPGLSFTLISELNQVAHRGQYDAVFCMEVLEHVVQVDTILDEMVALLKPGGRLLVSVPVEIGPPVVFKQAVRRIAGWRGIGDYPGTMPYTIREMVASVFAGPRQHVVRPIHRGPDDYQFHDHKGFNWKALRVALERRVAIEAVHTSPVAWLPPLLASQVWLSCRRPA